MTTFGAAFVGTWWLAAWLVATGGLALYSVWRRGPLRPLVTVLLVALAVGVPVLARVSGLAEALAVLALVASYDAAAYVVGTGADNQWEGPAAGIATVVATGLLVAALAVPPFTLFTVALLAIIVCVAGPMGTTVARYAAEPMSKEHAAEDDEAGAPEEAPAVRRLSTFLAAAPAMLPVLAYTALVS